MASALGCALLGAVVGLAVVVLHDTWVLLGLGVVACVCVLVAMPRAWWSRPPYVLAFAVIVFLAMKPRGEGDYLIAADASGYTLLVLTLMMVVAVLVLTPRPRAPRDKDA